MSKIVSYRDIKNNVTHVQRRQKSDAVNVLQPHIQAGEEMFCSPTPTFVLQPHRQAREEMFCSPTPTFL